jgi:Cu/Ag efflux protein CusF
MTELEEARQERDEAFGEFVKHSSLATKETLKAQAARKRYTLANEEVRSMERDAMTYGFGNLH